MQNWVKKLGADGDMREAAAMAMLKMIETRDLVDCTQKDSTSKEKPVSQKDMSAFIEDLVPGKSCRSSAALMVKQDSGHRRCSCCCPNLMPGQATQLLAGSPGPWAA